MNSNEHISTSVPHFSNRRTETLSAFENVTKKAENKHQTHKPTQNDNHSKIDHTSQLKEILFHDDNSLLSRDTYYKHSNMMNTMQSNHMDENKTTQHKVIYYFDRDEIDLKLFCNQTVWKKLKSVFNRFIMKAENQRDKSDLQDELPKNDDESKGADSSSTEKDKADGFFFLEQNSTVDFKNNKSRLQCRIDREREYIISSTSPTSSEKQSPSHLKTVGECTGNNFENEILHQQLPELNLRTKDQSMKNNKTLKFFNHSTQNIEKMQNKGDSFITDQHQKPNQTKIYDLIIHLHQFEFSSHPSFIEEESLIENLVFHFERYKTDCMKADLTYFSQRLEATITQINVSRNIVLGSRGDNNENLNYEKNAPKGLALSDLYKGMINEISKMIDLQHAIYCLEKKILSLWRKIESARKAQGFKCSYKEIVLNEEEECITKEKEFTTEKAIDGIRELSSWLIQNLQDDGHYYNKSMKKKDRREIYGFDLEETISSLEKIQCTSSKIGHIRMLENDHLLDQTDLSSYPFELNRREKLSKENYYAAIVVNGHVVEKTHISSLEWPTFQLQFNESFRLRLVKTQIDQICVQLWRKSSRLKVRDYKVCSNFIALHMEKNSDQKINMELFCPDINKYSFSENLQKHNYAKRQRVTARSIRGTALISYHWKSSYRTEKRNPSSYALNFSQQIQYNKKWGRSRQDHSYQGTKKELSCKKYHIYSENPLVTNIVNTLSMGFTFSVTRGTFFDYNVLEEPRRHILMKMRQFKKKSLESPIPANEDTIFSHEPYQQLMKQLHDTAPKLAETYLSRIDVELPYYNVTNIDALFHKIFHAKYLRERQRPARMSFTYDDVVRDASILRQSEPTELASLFNKILPSQKRGLYPVYKKEKSRSCRTKKVRFTLIIIGAKNLPERKSQKDVVTSRESFNDNKTSHAIECDRDHLVYSGGISNWRETNTVNTFLEIKFQEKTYLTKKIEGHTPMWKESFDLPIGADNNEDFSPISIANRNESIEVILFDAVELDMRDYGGFYDDEDTIITERRYLGHTMIPINWCSQYGHESLSIRLESPELIVGYTRDFIQQETRYNGFVLPSPSQGNSSEVDKTVQTHGFNYFKPTQSLEINKQHSSYQLEKSDPAIYLRAKLTMNPIMSLSQEHQISSNLLTKEDPSLVTHTKRWIDDCRRKVASCTNNRLVNNDEYKRCNLFVADIDGNEWLVTRHLRSLAPPSNFNSLQGCAFFVSLIPNIKDWSLVDIHKNFCCTNKQFIDVLVGCQLEHASLLANYFIYIVNNYPTSFDGEVYLVFGRAFPEGKTTYVMTKETETGKTLFWNASTGIAYDESSEKNPLHEIIFLITSKNVYANIQLVDRPIAMDFDIDKSSCWKPLFTNMFEYARTLSSVQENEIVYKKQNNDYAMEIEQELYDSIKTGIRSWRRTPSNFKVIVGNRLRNVLEDIEKNELKSGKVSHSGNDSVEEELRRIIPNSKGKTMYGFPLHFNLTTVEDILKKVKKIGIHKTKYPNAEFALSVRVFPYVSNIYSVRIFLLVLET